MKTHAIWHHRSSIAVAYLARGADDDWFDSLKRFSESYQKFPSGREHTLYVLYKGFRSDSDMDRAAGLFSAVNACAIKMDDSGFDIGAYLTAANEITEDHVCFVNTHSEVLASARGLASESNRLKLEVGKFLATVRAA